MADWRTIRKVDSHVHILPAEVLEANPDSDDEFSRARENDLLRIMDRYGIERSVIMTFNDPFLLSMDFSVEAVHRNLERICAAHPGRYAAFADIDTRNTPAASAAACEKALERPCFKGIKIHAANTGIAIDDSYYDDVLSMAEQGRIPVAFHSYPNRLRKNVCAPNRIANVLERHPDLIAIVCHLGAFQWKDAVSLNAWFDISAILPDYVLKYGVEKTNDILRSFPVNRLLFATDWPCSRSSPPEDIHERYFDILDQMDFTETEAQQIAYGNITKLLWSDQYVNKESRREKNA
ncbi:MAG: amidohydrolase family protein [Eubacterium sp.]|nr:amidohydrolase family protein [Eubacterium sp.]MCM1214809.1 amidohydrolase family protein [Lachnospiraceae bacterium]MCM1304613.1 amidohydrolase family protein [Butyrivibrio sp.]MCM1344265.1 amidohydrolase family protein [Muribaculaceae bacterium]MCM1241012.1 amidohydrolase family protein [Lachnospiraceae bacterium]